MARSDPHKREAATRKTAPKRTTKANADRTVPTEADARRAATALRLCPALLLREDPRVQAAYQVWLVRRQTLSRNPSEALDAAARQGATMDQIAAILTRKPEGRALSEAEASAVAGLRADLKAVKTAAPVRPVPGLGPRPVLDFQDVQELRALVQALGLSKYPWLGPMLLWEFERELRGEHLEVTVPADLPWVRRGRAPKQPTPDGFHHEDIGRNLLWWYRTTVTVPPDSRAALQRECKTAVVRHHRPRHRAREAISRLHQPVGGGNSGSVTRPDTMKWDDELERLSNAIVEAFGEDALNAAIERAYGHAAMRLHTEPSQRPPVATAAAGTPAGPTSFEECLRAELQQPPVPHKRRRFDLIGSRSYPVRDDRMSDDRGTSRMNQLFYGDNLDVLRRHIDDESVDLIYLDPPFNSNANYNVLFAERDGTKAAAQIKAFEDTWEWDTDAARAYQEVVESGGSESQVMQAFRTFLGESDMLAYLAMMAPRLVELRRVLKQTGGLYLHCDPTASHYLKMLLDAVYGPQRFRAEIVWKRTSAHSSSRTWGPVHDILLFYSKTDAYKWNTVFEAYSQEYLGAKHRNEDARGVYRLSDLTANGVRNGSSGEPWRGFNPTPLGRHWGPPKAIVVEVMGPQKAASGSTQEKLDALDAAGFIYWTPATQRRH